MRGSVLERLRLEEQPPRSRQTRRLLRYLIVFCAGALGALILLRFVPLPTQELGPARVRTSAQLGAGRTAFVIPPLGQISARTHNTPLLFRLELVQLDIPELGLAVSTSEGRRELTARIQRDLRGVLVRAGVLLVVSGGVTGALIGALIPYRKWKYIVAASAGGLLAVGSMFGLAIATFDPQGWRQPRFSGTLARAPDMLEAVNRNLGSIDNLRDRFEVASERISGLVALLARPLEDPAGGTIALLHVSDIHSNPVGVEVTRQLARQFDVSAVIDTGDLTSFGSPVEARIGDLLDNFPVPYMFVPGNHDSIANRAEIARIEDVTLLDKRARTVGGLDVLGWGDPTFTASNEISTEEGNEVREEEGEAVAAEVDALSPNVLAVHDQRLAQDSYGLVPLVISGHTHEREMRVEDGTVQLVVGSTGATGLGSFTIEADLPYEAQIIYFRDGLPVAVDYVSFRSLGAEFDIERTTIDVDEELLEQAGP